MAGLWKICLTSVQLLEPENLYQALEISLPRKEKWRIPGARLYNMQDQDGCFGFLEFTDGSLFDEIKPVNNKGLPSLFEP